MAQDLATGETREDDRYELDKSTVRAIVEAAEAGDAAQLSELIEPVHAADFADLLEQVETDEREAILRVYGTEFDGEILTEIDESIREEVIEALEPGVLEDAVRDLESDDVVDLIEDLDDAQQETILDALEDDDRAVVEQALAYPETSAGRLMQRELVAGPEHWTVGDAIDYLRARDDLPEDFYHMILVDLAFKPTGYVTLGKLLGHKREEKLLDITEDSFKTIEVTEDEGEVAYAFNQYHLISAPVVDHNGRLVGVITIDDAMMVLEDEAEEDMLRLAGVGEESSLADRVIATTKRRFPWLAVNLVTAVLASLVIAVFEDAIAQLVALAVLMPIVASMGGNAGTQSLTVAVRAIATKDLTGSNVWRVIRREALVGLVNGVLFALVMGAVGYVWFGSFALAGVIAIAMVINLVVAGLAGAVIPVALDRMRIDPALASGAFVTTVTDVVGFLAFLGLAVLVLL
ncbi:Mg/Co/Ni transporter MgtE [Candidatus Rhodobacter oscarellae]|uniref:Magnesium transporter MgtE n=1 Tax=Candidatus Rhodobacter oscarellae TaxID=1675527 RepID=A0A0J9E0T9_9RHOB|nr:magnesium transporter [Candidatus Rhodobacter lobularis]KMW56340.1 Mg/Co/Ni transporter MgtE [Candidatus Rhodobacter lobularis]